MVLRTFSWLDHFWQDSGPYGILGLEPGSATCQALPAVLSLQYSNVTFYLKHVGILWTGLFEIERFRKADNLSPLGGISECFLGTSEKHHSKKHLQGWFRASCRLQS